MNVAVALNAKNFYLGVVLSEENACVPNV